MLIALAFTIGMFFGWVLHARRHGIKKIITTDEKMDALLVSFLASYRGSANVASIRHGMEAHTRGEHDWFMKPDRKIYRRLDALVAEGVLVEDNRYYMLAA